MFGSTALIRASANGHTAAVELLLAAGADKEAKSKVREIERLTHKETERMKEYEWWPRRGAHSHYSPKRPAHYMCYAWGEGGSAAQAQFFPMFFHFDHF